MHNEVRLTLRTLAKSPRFTAVALLTLAIAIGADTAIFSVVKRVLLDPLPFADSGRLVAIWHAASNIGMDELSASPSTYLVYREESRVFEDVGLWRSSAATVVGLAEPERLRVLRVTDGVLPLLKVNAAVGRIFDRKDDQPSSPATVVLTHGYWMSRFGGDRGVVGRSLTVDGDPRTVIGVLPETFRFLNENPSLVLPLRIDRAKVFVGEFNAQGIARLRPGVTIEQANSDAARVLPMMVQRFPLPPGMNIKMLENARLTPALRPLKQDAVGDSGNILWVLLGSATVLLLIACANVANLMLVRGEGRQREFAVRVALGAHWRQLAKQQLAESALLGLTGGLLGLPLAYGALRTLVARGPAEIPRLAEISLDPGILLYAFGISLVSGLMFGLAPVLKFSVPRMALALREGGRGSSDGRERHYARNVLVVAQVAMALVLLVGSGLLLRTFQHLREVDAGFRAPEEVLTMRLALPQAEAREVVRTQQEIIRRLEQVPGVRNVAFAAGVTMDGNTNRDPIAVEEFPEEAGKIPTLRHYKAVSPGYFETMGNPVKWGRGFTWADIEGARSYVVVSENFARLYWKDPARALGKRVRETSTAPWREIIGVAGDERQDGAHRPAPAIVFWPIYVEKFWERITYSLNPASFLIRSPRAGTQGFLKEVQAAVWGVNPGIPVASVRTLEEVRSSSMMQTSFTLVLLGMAGGVALLLGVIGLYGVLSYTVAQRRREIGIRMAMGAQPAAVSRLFLVHGLRLTLVGVTAGVALAAAATRLLSALLHGVRPVDPLTFAAVPLLLAATAAAAAYGPARGAARVDPAEVLRAE